jgi:predicted peptidase
MRVFLIILILSIPFWGSAQSLELYQKETYRLNDEFVLPYRILYPEKYDPSVPYPLIVFLHGVLEKGKDNHSQLINGGALFLKQEHRERFPAIVIFPQCPEDSYWAAVDIDQRKLPIRIDFHYEDPPTKAMEACIGLVHTFIKEKKVNRRQIYVMGLSMGGMGTLEAISRYPELFAAAVPICGAGDTSYCHRYSGKVALWLFHGGADGGIDPECSRVIEKKVRSLGGSVRYTEYPGVGHNSWDKAFAEPELLPWLFRQRSGKKITFDRKSRDRKENEEIITQK